MVPILHPQCRKIRKPLAIPRSHDLLQYFVFRTKLKAKLTTGCTGYIYIFEASTIHNMFAVIQNEKRVINDMVVSFTIDTIGNRSLK